jgi:hypothetical protein
VVPAGTFLPQIERMTLVMATLTCPACAARVSSADLICFTCGANLPRVRLENEPDDRPAGDRGAEGHLGG